MKRIRVLFALGLLLFALPLWRYLDILSWLWPHAAVYSIAFFVLSFLFIGLPIGLFQRKIKLRYIFLGLIPLAILSGYLSPLSGMATREPSFTHCGRLTYSGFFYPVRMIMTEAHTEDLEVRNQLCWVKKMIQRLPERFENKTELETYLKITQDKLLKPTIKYRATLPMIALLHGLILSRYSEDDYLFENVTLGSFFVEGLQFWIDQYTFEIQSREYSFWNWPHSSYIKMEYGLIERNWETIVLGISTQE